MVQGHGGPEAQRESPAGLLRVSREVADRYECAQSTECVELFRKAAAKHIKLAGEAADGRGVDRHLFGAFDPHSSHH